MCLHFHSKVEVKADLGIESKKGAKIVHKGGKLQDSVLLSSGDRSRI